MVNRIIASVQTWSRILVVGFFAIQLIGCDSNNFPQSWAEFKAFNPFDPKSGAEIAVRRHFETHSKPQDGNMQFTGTLHTSFGGSADLWEVRNFDVKITNLAKVSEADRLNGIEGQTTFQVTCSAYRQRALYPKESKEWSLWKDGGQIFKGDAVKRKGIWSVQIIQNTPVGGLVQVSIEDPELYEKPETEKRLAEAVGTNLDRFPKKLAVMIEHPGDAQYFDSHTHVFEGSYEAVWAAVERTLKSRGDKVIARDQTAGTLMTQLTRHGILGSPVHDRFYIYFESEDPNHTNMEFILFSYWPNNEGWLVPIKQKEIVAKRAQKFLLDSQHLLAKIATVHFSSEK